MGGVYRSQVVLGRRGGSVTGIPGVTQKTYEAHKAVARWNFCVFEGRHQNSEGVGV